MKNTTPKVSEPRVSEKEMGQIINLASKMYADFDSTISLNDLLAAGNAADIPNQFIIAAHQQILDKRNKPTSQKISQVTLALVIGVSIVTVKFNSAITKHLKEYIPALNDSYISPKPYVPPDALYVQSIHSSWRKSHYDGNPIYDVAVYRDGNAGHVTRLTCILPPDIRTTSIGAITKGKQAFDKGHFCTPVDMSN